MNASEQRKEVIREADQAVMAERIAALEPENLRLRAELKLLHDRACVLEAELVAQYQRAIVLESKLALSIQTLETVQTQLQDQARR
jgi:hypothetical protein